MSSSECQIFSPHLSCHEQMDQALNKYWMTPIFSGHIHALVFIYRSNLKFALYDKITVREIAMLAGKAFLLPERTDNAFSKTLHDHAYIYDCEN